MESVRTLLANSIDCAGLFPPTQLKMQEAVGNYRDYLAGADRWALGRFIVPVARLPELEYAVRGLGLPDDQSRAWRLSALGGPDLAGDVQLVTDFNDSWSKLRTSEAPKIDTIELRVSTIQDIEQAAKPIPEGFRVYLEVLVNTDPDALVTAVGELGFKAKVRTGGVHPEMIPATGDLARFIECCHERHVPFKATGGLHHPIRCVDRLTGNRNGPSALMHGFLNLFLGATFCRLGMDSSALLSLLEEDNARSFRFEDTGVSWREYKAGLEEIRTARKESALAFGSWSLTGPLEGLRSLHLL